MHNSSKQNSINIKMAQNIMFSLHLMKSILNSEHYLNIQYSKVFKYSYKHFFFSSNIQTCKIFYEYIFRVWTFVHVIFQEYKYIQTFVCVEIFTNITVPSTKSGHNYFFRETRVFVSSSHYKMFWWLPLCDSCFINTIQFGAVQRAYVYHHFFLHKTLA